VGSEMCIRDSAVSGKHGLVGFGDLTHVVGDKRAEGATGVESTPTEVAQMPKKPAKKDAKKPKSK